MSCLKYLKSIYELTYSLVDIYEFIYACCTYANKMILWEGSNTIRMFVEILVDYLGRANVNEEEGFAEGCYLMEVVIQNFEAYFEDN